jgi:hypothetical protein
MIDGLGHASAHEQLLDLALEPEGLAALSMQLATGTAPDSPLAAHVAACPVCRRDLATWSRTHAAVREALGDPGEGGLAALVGEPLIAAPEELRAAVRAGIVRAGAAAAEDHRTVSMPATPTRLTRVARGLLRRWIGPATRQRRLVPVLAVAGLAVLLIGSGALFLQAQALDRARADTAALQGLTATLDRVISDPSHRVVALRAADGNVAGSVSWSSHDIVVLTTALEPPPAGRVYRCWIERAGERSSVGMMWFAGSTAYWSGSIDTWAATTFDAGGTFGVSLEPADGPGTAGTAVLAADLTAPYVR